MKFTSHTKPTLALIECLLDERKLSRYAQWRLQVVLTAMNHPERDRSRDK